MAQKLMTRPSALLGVVDSWVAFCTDRAVYMFGTFVEGQMDEAEGRLPENAKTGAHQRARQRVLDDIFGIEASEQPHRFRSVGG